jgi:hypothetical protein
MDVFAPTCPCQRIKNLNFTLLRIDNNKVPVLVAYVDTKKYLNYMFYKFNLSIPY